MNLLLNGLTYITETLLVIFCSVFMYIIKGFDWFIKTILKIAEVFIVIFIFLSAHFFLSELPQPWQGLVIQVLLLGASITFISIIALMIWKPTRLSNIFEKL